MREGLDFFSVPNRVSDVHGRRAPSVRNILESMLESANHNARKALTVIPVYDILDKQCLLLTLAFSQTSDCTVPALWPAHPAKS
jgi:hypothetical protein